MPNTAAIDEAQPPVLDPGELGRLLRGARILAGYIRVSDVTRVLAHEYGMPISDRTLYAVERGEQPTYSCLLMMLMLLYRPPGGITFLMPAIRQDMRSGLLEVYAPAADAK